MKKNKYNLYCLTEDCASKNRYYEKYIILKSYFTCVRNTDAVHKYIMEI